MSWRYGLVVVGLLYVGFLVALCRALAPKKPFIPYRALNKHRITPDFRVGSDVK